MAPFVGLRLAAAPLEAVVIGATAASLMTSVIVSRSVGPSGRGTLGMIAVWTLGVALVGLLSLDKGVMLRARTWQENGPGATDERAARVRGLQDSLFLPVLLLCGTSAAVCAAALYWRTGSAWIAVMGALATSGSAFSEWRAGGVLALGRWSTYKAYRLAQPFGYLLSVAVVALVLHDSADETRVVFMAAGFVASVGGGLVVLRSGGGSSPLARHTLRRSTTPPWSEALRYHLTTVSTLLATRADLLFVPLVMSLDEVGIYAVAAAPGALLATIGSAALLRALTSSNRARLPVLPLLGVLGLVAAGCLCAPVVIPPIFGQDFTASVPASQILMVAGGLAYASQWITGRLAVIDRPGLASVPQLIAVAAVVAGLLFFSTVLGLAVSVLVGRSASIGLGLVLLRAGHVPPAPRPSADDVIEGTITQC